MSDHTNAFVPVASGYFQSPELAVHNISVDIGLLAEALLYFNSITLHVDNSDQFGQLIGLLFKRGLSHKNLIQLLKDGTLKFAFTSMVMPFMGTSDPNVVTALYLMKDKVMDDDARLFDRFIRNPSVKIIFSRRLLLKTLLVQLKILLLICQVKA